MLRAACVRQHAIFMQSQGVPVERLLEGTRLDGATLSNPTLEVSIEDCYRVLENALRLSDDSILGLHLGARIGFSELGIIGYALMSATSLRQALTLWLDYLNSPLGFPLDSRLEVIDDNRWGISAIARSTSLAIDRLSIEEYLAMGMHLGHFLVGENLVLSKIAFSFPEPASVAAYQAFFNCPMEFNAPRTLAVVQGLPLDTPLRSANEEMRRLCLGHYDKLKVQYSRHGPVSTRLKNTLILLGSIPGLDEAADHLNLSPRSLRRHLKAENTTFQQVLDEFRKELACEYLKSDAISVKEIAYLLGFSGESNFRRAFKSWMGMTVGAYSNSKGAE